MSGEFTLEDKSGKIILATSPGMEVFTENKSNSRKLATSTKKVSRKSSIQFFIDLALSETDKEWIAKFEKMALYKFPRKISWNPSADKNIHGELLYKNKKSIERIEIRLDVSLEKNRDLIKDFVDKHTNFEENITIETYILDDPVIEPMPWSSLKPKEQVKLITNYINEFAIDNNLTIDQKNILLNYVIVYFMGKDIKSLITYNNGVIENISGIYQTSSGIYKMKNL